MADSNLDLGNFGGRLQLDTGVLFSTEDVDKIGDTSIRTVLQLLRVLFYDENQGLPQTGVAGFTWGTLGSGDEGHLFAAKGGGDLDWTVEPGWGLAFDSGATPDDFEVEAYRPVVLDAQDSGSLGSHAANPRIDIIVAYPAWAEDVAATRGVRDPGPPVVLTTPSINTRRRFSATISVVAGTPAASPSPPATPAGAILLAECLVPATSGAITVTDRRKFLRMSGVTSSLTTTFAASHVLSGLNGTFTGGTHDGAITQGQAYVHGVEHNYAAADYTFGTVGGLGNARNDVVYADVDGTISVAVGTPATAGSQVDPAVPDNGLPLYSVSIANAIGITSSRDLRVYAAVGPDQIQAGGVEEANLADGSVSLAKIKSEADVEVISGAAFDASSSLTKTRNGAKVTFSDLSAHVVEAPIRFRDGTSIDEIVFYIDNNTSSGITFTCSLHRVNLSTGSVAAVISQATLIGATTQGTVTITGPAVLDQTTYAYSLTAVFTIAASGGVSFLGAKTTHTSP